MGRGVMVEVTNFVLPFAWVVLVPMAWTVVIGVVVDMLVTVVVPLVIVIANMKNGEQIRHQCGVCNNSLSLATAVLV